MAGIAFVNGQDLQHVTVVFLQKTLHLLRRPIRRRRADGVIAVGVGVQRRRVVEIRQRISAAEFRHHDHLAAVRVRQLDVIPFPDESLDVLDGGARVRDQVLRLAVVLVDRVNDFQDGFALAGGVVRRQRLLRKILAPKLARDDIHVAPDLGEFCFGVRQVLFGGDARIGFQLKFFVELSACRAAIRRWRAPSTALRGISDNPSAPPPPGRRRLLSWSSCGVSPANWKMSFS